MSITTDYIEEILKDSKILNEAMLDFAKYNELLDKHEEYYLIEYSDNNKIQTFYNHLNRLLEEKNSSYITDIIGKYNTFRILMGIKQETEKYKNIEILIQNIKNSSLIAQMEIYKVIEKDKSEKTDKDIIVNKDFYLKVVLYDGDLETIRTTEFGFKLLNAFIGMIIVNRGLPSIDIDL